MDFFGIGPINLLVIAAVALIVFGPERLPEMAAKAGKLMRDLRSYASDMTSEFSGEFSEIQQQFNGIQEGARSFGSDLHNTAAGMGETVRSMGDGLAEHPETSVDGVNEPPPAHPEKIVPLAGASVRPRIDDYKPGQ